MVSFSTIVCTSLLTSVVFMHCILYMYELICAGSIECGYAAERSFASRALESPIDTKTLKLVSAVSQSVLPRRGGEVDSVAGGGY